MSNYASEIVKDSDTTPPASDEQVNQARGELVRRVDQQTRPQANQGSFLQHRPESNVNEHAASHLDQTQGQIGNKIVHDSTSTTRNATNNYDGRTADDHVHDTTAPTLMQTLQDRAHTLVEGPVETLRKDLTADSHELAHEVPNVRGAIQTAQPSSSNAATVRDVGWHKANVEIPDPLIGGYTNGELFALIRRFNKVRFHSPSMLREE